MIADTRVSRPRPLVIGVPILIAYAVVIGGAPAGELFGPLRAVSAVIAGAVIFAYIRSLPRRHDAIDIAMVVALLCVAAASLLSAFPRQSLDAVLGSLLYVSGFGLARRVLRSHTMRSVVGKTMMLLSVVVTGLLGMRIGAATLEFLALTDWSIFPPLGLRVDTRPWGHPYDVALLGVMLYPAWFLLRPSRLRAAVAAIIGSVLVATIVLMGSRAVWGAAIAGTILWILPLIGGRWRTWRRQTVAMAAGATAVLGGVVLLGAPAILHRVVDVATLGQRGQMWIAGFEAWLMRPFAGFGPGSFPWALQQTDYFDTNTLAPRHPDSAVFQLLPEAGLLGLISVAVILISLTPRLRRKRSSNGRFALGAFAVATFGMNPTDFPFLIVVAILWAAMGSPRVGDERRAYEPRSRRIVIATYGSVAIVGIAVVSVSVAGVYYDLAGRFAASGELDRAGRSLDTAVLFDPGMALYWRQRGTVQLLQGEPDAALSDLRTATEINPSDDLAWRTLALAYREAGRREDALAAVGEAAAVQRSDPTNLLLSAAWTAPSVAADALLAELAQAWPTLLSAPAWDEVASGHEATTRVADLALRRSRTGAASLEPQTTQEDWLMLVTSPDELLSKIDATPGDRSLMDASLRLSLCGQRAASTFELPAGAAPRLAGYWALVVQLSAERGDYDERAARAYSLIAGADLHREVWQVTLNPLHENDTRGYSMDQWGYRRIPIKWPEYNLRLPSPRAGADRWILDPAGAREQAQVTPPSGC